MALKASSLEVLRIIVSIGGVKTQPLLPLARQRRQRRGAAAGRSERHDLLTGGADPEPIRRQGPGGGFKSCRLDRPKPRRRPATTKDTSAEGRQRDSAPKQASDDDPNEPGIHRGDSQTRQN
jgi:hypothetical protein